MGTLEKHELTKTTARVRVSVDGLKPLVKTFILEFDSGEESVITLEYERLEHHCDICFSLSHASRDCPHYMEQQIPPAFGDSTQLRGNSHSLAGNRESPALLERSKVPTAEEAPKSPPNRSKAATTLDERVPVRASAAYQNRVDRHGRSFGDRVSTRQTRRPPPSDEEKGNKPNLTQRWRPTRNIDSIHNLSSPQFARNRTSSMRAYDSRYRRPLFPQEDRSHWREKAHTPSNRPEEADERPPLDSNEHITMLTPQNLPPIREMPTREEVMEDLHWTTLQYINCADPIESAARRQRVLAGDAQGDTEEAADRILASNLEASRMGQLARSSENQITLQANSTALTSYQQEENSPHIGAIVSQDTGTATCKRKRCSPFSRSPIENLPANSNTIEVDSATSPVAQLNLQSCNNQRESLSARGNETNENNTSLPRQVRAKTTSTRTKSVAASPKLFRGASSSRKLQSMIQRSPAQTPQRRLQSQIHVPERVPSAANAPPFATEPTVTPAQPTMQIIPPSNRRRKDFHIPPPPAP